MPRVGLQRRNAFRVEVFPRAGFDRVLGVAYPLAEECTAAGAHVLFNGEEAKHNMARRRH